MKSLIVGNKGYTGFKMTNQNVILENVNGHQVMKLKGPLQRADAVNQNSRVYPYKILAREVEKFINTQIKEKRAYGELDHPSSGIVELKTTSHTIEKLWWEGKELWGVIEILDTPNGNIVQELVKKGKAVGISSRGLGTLSNIDENTVQVEDDLELITWDIVSNPSTHGSFVVPIQEGIQTKENKLITLYNTIENDINDIISTF